MVVDMKNIVRDITANRDRYREISVSCADENERRIACECANALNMVLWILNREIQIAKNNNCKGRCKSCLDVKIQFDNIENFSQHMHYLGKYE